MHDQHQFEEDDDWDRGELEDLTKKLSMGGERSLKAGDADFVQECRDLMRRPGRGFNGLPWLALLCVGLLLFWASRAELEEVTRGHGKVIPSKSVQQIQSLEGGIMEEIYVREGDQVEAGQPLLRIRDAIFASNYQENLAKRDILAARVVRLKAEAGGATELLFPEGIRPDLIEAEAELFEKRRNDYVETRLALEELLELAVEEERLLAPGVRTRAVSRVELIRAQKAATDLKGKIRVLKTNSERAAMEQYDRDKAELEAVEQAILRDKDRLDRTLITSTVRGTVNTIYIDSVGRVIASGVDIMAIVPLDDTLLIEANIRPSDIAFIRPGHQAMVKFTAYDFSIYGGLAGTVEQIGVDTVMDERGESYYQIKVRTPETTLGKGRDGEEMEIIPGMVTEVDILTGRKTVLTYLLKPINRARERALRER